MRWLAHSLRALSALHGWAHPSRASHTALLQRWQPKGSSLQRHCTARVPSTDTASSRAGVVGSVQSITKAFVVQACIRLDLSAAHIRLHTSPCYDGMIAPFILECKPDVRNVPGAMSGLRACIVRAPRLHPPASPPIPDSDPHKSQPQLARPPRRDQHCRKNGLIASPICPCPVGGTLLAGCLSQCRQLSPPNRHQPTNS